MLNPAFVEWMQGLPAGWVTDLDGLTRNDMLRLLGNGVVPQQAAAALRMLLAHDTAVSSNGRLSSVGVDQRTSRRDLSTTCVEKH